MSAPLSRRAILDAVARRKEAGLGCADTTAYRLVHREHDALAGWTADRIGEVVYLTYRARGAATPAALDLWASALGEVLALGALVVRWDAPANQGEVEAVEREQVDAHVDALGLAPTTARAEALESGLRYAFAFDRGRSHGLFFDMREPRRDLRARWSGGRVLNLFSYTCGFGVALGARCDVVNVDVSRAYLDWGAENYALNGLDAPASAFVKKDAFDYLRVAAKVGNRFDAIVLDPPAFSRGKRGKARRFRLEKDLEQLLEPALAALTPEGELFVAANVDGWPRWAFDKRVARAAEAHGRRVVRGWDAAADYPAPREAYHLKTALISGR